MTNGDICHCDQYAIKRREKICFVVRDALPEGLFGIFQQLLDDGIFVIGV